MTSIRLTAEQQNALTLFSTGASLVVEAGAGTGKTSTLVAFANSTTRRGQYVAFNKAIVEEAKTKFPATVSCNTAHSLAFRAVGRQFAARLRGRRMTTPTLARMLGITDPIALPGTDGQQRDLSYVFLTSYVMDAVKRFCQSADDEIGHKHFPYIEGIDVPDPKTGRRTYRNNDKIRARMLPYAEKVWADAQDVNGQFPYCHDYYLKMYERSNPKIGADYVMFDEAQDASPVLLSIVQQQTDAQLVFVGDSAQQIYSFTGARNALTCVNVSSRAMLTQSFRFGPDVADAANVVLGRLGTAMRLRGLASIPSTVGPVDNPTACLARTNATAVARFITDKAGGGRPHLVGGGKDTISFARAAAELQAGKRVNHRDLACFRSWAEVQDYVANDSQGEDLKLMVKLVDKFSALTIVDALERMVPAERATVIISTAHKAKGLEWDTVKLLDDFPVVAEMDEEELRLLYVATTRAKIRLDSTAIRWEKEKPAEMGEGKR